MNRNVITWLLTRMFLALSCRLKTLQLLNLLSFQVINTNAVRPPLLLPCDVFFFFWSVQGHASRTRSWQGLSLDTGLCWFTKQKHSSQKQYLPTSQMPMMQRSLSLGSEQPPGRFDSKNKRAAGANRNKHWALDLTTTSHLTSNRW